MFLLSGPAGRDIMQQTITRSEIKNLSDEHKPFTGSGKKSFILDTSVIIHDPSAVYQFGEHDIVIPLAVIKELDGFKNGNDQKAFNAREFSRILDQLKEEYKTLLEPVPLPYPSEGTIRIAPSSHQKDLPPDLQPGNNDSRIIATALKISKKSGKKKTVLVSKDTNVRLLGHSCGLITEDYKRGHVPDVERVNIPPASLTLNDSIIDTLMKEEFIYLADADGEEENLTVSGFNEDFFYWNQCLTLHGNNSSHSVLGTIDYKFGRKGIRRLLKEELSMWGLVPRNREQTFAAYLLLNPEIRLVTLNGKAGTGKTLLALAAGLEQTCEVPAGKYKKIIVIRPAVSVGKEMGFLPGDLKEKIAPWMKPVYDNISFLMRDSDSKNRSKADQLFESGVIEIEPLSFIRGRSLNDAFIIIDESQNLTPHEIKTVITRAAGKSKVILTGDLDQIDTPYLDRQSSGLAHVLKKFRGQQIFGHITLSKGERSGLADLAADLL